MTASAVGAGQKVSHPAGEYLSHPAGCSTLPTCGFAAESAGSPNCRHNLHKWLTFWPVPTRSSLALASMHNLFTNRVPRQPRQRFKISLSVLNGSKKPQVRSNRAVTQGVPSCRKTLAERAPNRGVQHAIWQRQMSLPICKWTLMTTDPASFCKSAPGVPCAARHAAARAAQGAMPPSLQRRVTPRPARLNSGLRPRQRAG